MIRTRAILSAVLLVACSRPDKPLNQLQDSRSPSGKYIVTVPIELHQLNPTYIGTPVWKVTICDAATKAPIYKDEASEFVGTLNVYWGWDRVHDILWLFNSDDGTVWTWNLQDDGIWSKTIHQGYNDIPEWILPDNAKKRKSSPNQAL